MKILAFDPGETTGWALMKWDRDSAKIPFLAPKNSYKVSTGELDHYEGIKALITKAEPAIVVYEGFKLYPWKAEDKIWSNFPTVEVIGVIKYIVENDFPEIKLKEQLPKDKKLCDDSKLKQMGLYSGISPHERDAIRHTIMKFTKLYKE